MIKVSANRLEKYILGLKTPKLMYEAALKALRPAVKDIKAMGYRDNHRYVLPGLMELAYGEAVAKNPAYAVKRLLRAGYRASIDRAAQQVVPKGRDALRSALKSKHVYAKSPEALALSPWAAAAKADPEAMVTIAHGGGEDFLRRFLAGKAPGYKLEHSMAKGIQVHPVKKHIIPGDIQHRVTFYSGKRAPLWGDHPAKLTGRIKAKHLTAQPNLYEAGLPTSAVPHLQGVQIERVPYQEVNQWLPMGVDRFLKRILEHPGGRL